MLPILINQFYNAYYFQSKYSFMSLKKNPSILQLTFKTLIYLKKSKKYFLFLKILHLLMFNNKSITLFVFKKNDVNFIITSLKSIMQINIFLHNFVYIYLPLIDSFLID